MDLSTEEDRNGYFLHHSLRGLFRLIHDGWRHELKPQQLGDFNFRMEPLRCDLFDPSRTALLNRVRLRNHVLQEVIELLSLSREQRNRRRGRISYSQLGINQLGAVYEGLLSYTGFFVEEKDGLYGVKPEGVDYDPLKQAYFVPKTALTDYKEEEKVYLNGRLVHHPQGQFVYRLAGRNRQKSASYYTPDVLTQCVVEYALKELLKDKQADDILALSACEPALGSGAFLNEAVNQLADAYLERKQCETGRVIPHDDYLLEKQKVKAYLADNRVFGVDRNPVAIELAEISLCLNTIYEGHTIPWFGGQLVAGNSLIGAARCSRGHNWKAQIVSGWMRSRSESRSVRSSGTSWRPIRGCSTTRTGL
jgi:type II restriction/modification system DNA methylase subunit YeeA